MTSNGRQQTSQSVVNRWDTTLVSMASSKVWPQNGHWMDSETCIVKAKGNLVCLKNNFECRHHRRRPTHEMRMRFLFFLSLLMSAFWASAAGTFQNPLNPGADPWMVYYRSNYYLSTTQGDAVRIWKAPTLAALKTARAHRVWHDDDPSRSTGIWAPEFHLLGDHWYLYYTATSSDNNDDNHRMHVLESAGDDPLGPYHYKSRLINPTNDHYAIDGTVFTKTNDGSLYFLWAARPHHVLFIARMTNPWTIQGNGVSLPADGFGCEKVREGPSTLQRNGRIFLIYSACDAGTPDYKLGMLVADENSDLMDPHSWRQYPGPVLQRSDANGVFGPGHNGFFQSPDGREDWIVYHGKTSADYTYAGRSTRAQKFTWRADGTPDFGIPLPLDAVLDEPSNLAK
jgi:GH43 family beta-xylosidase